MIMAESNASNLNEFRQDEAHTNMPVNASASSVSKAITFFKLDDLVNQQQLLPNYVSNISDQVKVGFYSLDRCTQTESSDILPIQEATHNLIYLCKEIDVVKYDLNFAKNSYQNKFDQELYSKSVEIYSIINQKFNALKKQQEENIDRIRKAYKSQLANAIVKITNIADAKYQSRLPENSGLDKGDFKTQALMQRIKELQRVISENEYTMKASKEKNDELIERIISNSKATIKKMKEDNERALSAVAEERDNAYQEINNMKKKLGRLEEALNIKEEESERLTNEITELNLQLDNEKTLNEQVNREYQDFKNKAEIEKQKLKKELEKQKKDMEIKMQEKIKETREQVTNQAKEEMRLQQLEQEKVRQAMEERQRQQEKKQQELLAEQLKKEEALKKSLQQQQEKQQKLLDKAKHDKEKELDRLQKEKEKIESDAKNDAKNAAVAAAASVLAANEHAAEHKDVSAKAVRKEEHDLIHKLKHTDAHHRAEITRLQREINRNNETWEKRFDILKHSLHAIKDEMYLRQNLQKNSVQLAYASIAYTMDEAPAQQPQSKNETNTMNHLEMKITKPVLPSIGKNNERQHSSLTVSMPSRLSHRLEIEDTQILDDDEMKKFKDEYLVDVDYIIAK